jgi:hypothetical protein
MSPGPFAMGYTEFYNFLIPLYGLPLGMSAGQIGMLVWTAMALAPVFPLLPWFWPLLLLRSSMAARFTSGLCFGQCRVISFEN